MYSGSLACTISKERLQIAKLIKSGTQFQLWRMGFQGENKNMMKHFIKVIYTQIFLCKNRLISTLGGRGVLWYLKLGHDCSEFFNFHPSLTDGTGKKLRYF